MYQRHIDRRIREALKDTRVVLIAGPRQAGKTTLAKQIAGDGIPFFTLDDPTIRAAAASDPFGFIRGLDRAVIDEIQRVPDLLLAIKASVDDNTRPGRFLLTGSANLMALPLVADSLAGRMEVVRLLPLAQSEIHTRTGEFLDKAFAGEGHTISDPIVGAQLVETVLGGGYPEALTRKQWSRRQDWYLDYVDAIVQRDIKDVAQIEQLHQIPRLLRIMAEHSGQLTNYSQIGGALGMNHNTTQKYVGVLESVFLTETLPPWFTNKIKRVVKTPKLQFLDAGLLAALRDLTADHVAQDRTAFGAVLETFVFSELRKLASWSQTRANFYHFRDRAQNEVDIILEDRRGRVIGIEVKAAATVTQDDFKGLKKLQEALGTKFIGGIVLYDHTQTVPYSETLAAVPISALWA